MSGGLRYVFRGQNAAVSRACIRTVEFDSWCWNLKLPRPRWKEMTNQFCHTRVISTFTRRIVYKTGLKHVTLLFDFVGLLINKKKQTFFHWPDILVRETTPRWFCNNLRHAYSQHSSCRLLRLLRDGALPSSGGVVRIFSTIRVRLFFNLPEFIFQRLCR